MFKKATFSPAHPRRAETRLFHGVGRSKERWFSVVSVQSSVPETEN